MDIKQSILTSEAAQARLTQLLATMREVFWIAPLNGSEGLLVNPAYERVFGYQVDELSRRRWVWLRSVSKEDRRKILKCIRNSRNGGEQDDVEIRIRHRDNSRRWLLCRITPIHDPEMGAGAVMGLALDITQRKLLQNRLLGVAEQERQRIGMELHDDLCQRLAGLRLKVGVLTNSLQSSDSKTADLARRVAEELSEAVGIARLFARGLAPVELDRLGLSQAMKDLAETVEKTFGIACLLDLPETFRDLPSEISTHVFRAIQELAANAAKHSSPDWIQITLVEKGDRLMVNVSHNGSSFIPNEVESNGGLGLHFLQQRLDALGTSLRRGKKVSTDGKEIVTAVFEIEIG